MEDSGNEATAKVQVQAMSRDSLQVLGHHLKCNEELAQYPRIQGVLVYVSFYQLQYKDCPSQAVADPLAEGVHQQQMDKLVELPLLASMVNNKFCKFPGPVQHPMSPLKVPQGSLRFQKRWKG